jgi:hypothetical protein
MGIDVKRFSSPDEERPFVGHGRMAVLSFGEHMVGRGVFEPGWRWSSDVKPIAGTESCEASHACYVLNGRMHIVCNDGEEADVGPGDVFFLAPGHDAWVVGDEPCVALDFAGAAHYARARAGSGARAVEETQPQPSP